MSDNFGIEGTFGKVISSETIDVPSVSLDALGQQSVQLEPVPLRYVEPPSALDTPVDAVQRGLDAVGDAVPRAVAQLDPVTVTQRGLEGLHSWAANPASAAGDVLTFSEA